MIESCLPPDEFINSNQISLHWVIYTDDTGNEKVNWVAAWEPLNQVWLLPGSERPIDSKYAAKHLGWEYLKPAVYENGCGV